MIWLVFLSRSDAGWTKLTFEIEFVFQLLDALKLGIVVATCFFLLLLLH
jgi:hypothetical protein